MLGLGGVAKGVLPSHSGRLDALPADDNSSCKDSQESLADDLSTSTLAYDSDGDTLVDGKPDLNARNTRLGTICHGGIDLFLLRSPDNPTGIF